MKSKIFVIFYLFLSIFLFAQNEIIYKTLESDFYQTQFTGLYLYDPLEHKEVLNYNGNKYFTPASNTKIFTLYAAMKTLKDSIPAFRYLILNDELHIEGTADPTFFHPKFKNPKVLEFLKNTGNKIVLHYNNFDQEAYAPGWTWDDFTKDYAPERSQFPIHENSVLITKSSNSIQTYPYFFKDQTIIKDNNEPRELYENKFYISSKVSRIKVPFIVKEEVIQKALSEILGKSVELTKSPLLGSSTTYYSMATDKVYKEMMEESDNFLAEHLLLLVSSTMQGKLNTEQAINYISTNYLKDLKQKPIWKDGSGLSRYNLFTPQNMAQILEKLYNEFPEERLHKIFPVGGKTGTIKHRYKDMKTPYVFAKTGGMNNTVTLSGYLKTKSGRTLIFSLMNNNSIKDSSLIRSENEKLIKLIRDLY